MKAHLKRFFGRTWRMKTRPRILARAGGHLDEQGQYTGGASCERCGVPDYAVLSIWVRSTMEIAHLDQNPGPDVSDDRLACLCHKCHRQHDYQHWALEFGAWLDRQRELRVEKKDNERPILRYLKEIA